MPAPFGRSLLPYLALLGSVLLWGATGVVGKEALQQIPLFSLLFLRSCVAGLAIVPFFLFDGNRIKLQPRAAIHLLTVGMLGMTLNIGLFFYGLRTASILNMSVLTAMTPLFISLASWYFLRERLGRTQILGFIIATTGVIVVLAEPGGNSGQLIGNLCVLASCLTTVAYTILTKELSHHYPPVVLVAASCAAAILGFAPLAGHEWLGGMGWVGQIQPRVWLAVLYLGLGSSVLAFVGYTWALQKLPASRVAAMSYLQPLTSIFLAVWFLHEDVQWQYVLGGLVAGVGIFLALRQPHLRHTPAVRHLPARPTHIS